MAELERRLESHEEAKDLPGTLLMRLVEQYLRYLDKKAKEEEEELHYLTPLEAIDQPGLPVENKIEILTEYLKKLEEDKTQAQERLNELQLEVINGLQTMQRSEPS
jgi:hypothetical protein